MNRLCARLLRRVFRGIELGTWRLPFEYAMHVLDGTREAELKYLDEICTQAGVAVDAGANIGYYTYRMAKRFRHVYAFEPNMSVSSPIRSAHLGNVTLIDKGISNKEFTGTLYVPVKDGVVLSGWASMDPNNCPNAPENITLQIALTTLDAAQLEEVALIKIDVEGHELAALQGARQTIAASKPTLIVEIKNDNFPDVCHLLESYGYTMIPMEELVARPGSAENFVFRPKDQIHP